METKRNRGINKEKEHKQERKNEMKRRIFMWKKKHETKRDRIVKKM